MVLVLAMAALAQAPPPAQTTDLTNIYAAGISYNNGGKPQLSGSGLWAHKVADTGTYAFTVVDVVTVSKKPFTVSTNFGLGVAQKVFTIGKVPVFVPTSAGVSYTGGNTGWAWSTGALASIPFKGQYRIMPNVRLIKSSVDTNGYQPVIGVMFGWGQ